MNHTVQFSVRIVPGEFELVYRLIDQDAQASDPVVLVYPSQAEMQDDLRGAHLPVSLSVVGEHEPVQATDEQLRLLGREDTQELPLASRAGGRVGWPYQNTPVRSSR